MPNHKPSFRLDFFLVDDDPALNQLIRAALSTRKLRRLCESAVQGHFGGLIEVKRKTHYAGSADAARQLWADLAEEYGQEKDQAGTGETDSDFLGYCTIAFVDFDMPVENGLELTSTLKDEPIEMLLFTGRQPQMQAFLSDAGKTLEDFGIKLLMLKGAPAQELNDGVLTLLKGRLEQLVSK